MHIDRTVRLEKQILPRIFYNYLVTAKNFQMTFPFMYYFRSLSNDSLRFSEVSFFIFYSPG